jgi:ASC-1-like (ASCH) protein
MRIEKKILPEYFELVLNGKKKYDFRLADFDIKEGDLLVLKEWDKEKQSFTGREIKKNVSYVGKTKGDTTWSRADIDEYGYQIISFE